jgi:hypothetical protein
MSKAMAVLSRNLLPFGIVTAIASLPTVLLFNGHEDVVRNAVRLAGNGRIQSFEHGQMVWVPDAANRAPGVIAAWATDRDVVVDWTLGHYNYDFFLVRWDKDGRNIGQVDEKGARVSGRRAISRIWRRSGEEAAG